MQEDTLSNKKQANSEAKEVSNDEETEPKKTMPMEFNFKRF